MPATAITMAEFEEAETRLMEDATLLLSTWLAPVQMIDCPMLEDAPYQPRAKAKAPARSKRKSVRAQSNR